ncbi:nitrogen regulation protein NR(II) [Geobacter sp. DSM 9736]|uniref:two-component system sensor histidine kinase NtrB n=1 Tax=Geobacter sp. DSM 9736 TaxID=1277350 RepID=UPI000B5140CC|nr:ATP-binding protein [Geobacter sp. DSM 9736]
MTARSIRQTGIRLLVLTAFIGGISLFHYLTPLNRPMLHDIFQRLYHLPIILAAFWFGLRGGLGCALCVSFLYIPHLIFQWGPHTAMELERYLEILLYNVVGGVTGFLSERETNQRKILEESNLTLQFQAETIVRIEDELRRAERLSTLGELSAVLAHEIRNPLGSIQGTAEILRDDYSPGDRKYEFIQILLKESERLNRVVEDFLRLARPRPATMTACDIIQELRAVATLARIEARKRGIDLELKDVPLPLIQADGEKLRQAFLNILLNALQATPSGGKVTVTAALSELDGGRWILLSFDDTGGGISGDVMEQIFEPFYTTKESGTGLGLAVTRKIIQAHGGSVTLQSEVGRGTSVCVRLPLMRKELEAT